MENINSSQEIKALEEKKFALEQAVQIAQSIERLQESLAASLLLGKSSSDIPQSAIEAYEQLDASTRSQSIDQLRQSLSSLERVISADIKRILQISEMPAEALGGASARQIYDLLNNFRKQAQTAVALRVLLHARGDKTEATSLPVSSQQIRARLTEVNEKEQAYRRIIRNELVSTINETNRILDNTHVSDAMRALLLVSNQDMTANLQHLDSGKPITQMPVPMEIINLSEHSITTLDTSPEQKNHEALPSMQKQPLFVPSTPATAPADTARLKKDDNLLKNIWRWATTPTTVSWKDVKSEDKKKPR